MYHRFILSPEAEQAVKPLEKKIQKIAKGEKYAYVGYHHFPDDQLSLLREIRQSHLSDIPGNIGKTFKRAVNDLLQGKRKEYLWKVDRPDGSVSTEETRENDILLISGYIASLILKPEEFWDYERHGLKSPTDWMGSVGAAVLAKKERPDYPGGYSWKSEWKGQAYETTISGDTNGDLRIQRTNLSSLPARDPFGQIISYRPILSEDTAGVYAYHSCEPDLFAAALKYAEQENLDIPFLRDGAKDLLEEMNSCTQKMGNYADFGSNGGNPSLRMMNFFFPMPCDTDARGFMWTLCKEHRGDPYAIHIDEERNFCISSTRSDGSIAKEGRVVIPAAEMQEFIRGVYIQARNGRGRTSVRELSSLLEYRHSKEFSKDMERMKSDFEGLL